MKKKYLLIIALLLSSIFSYGQCTNPDIENPTFTDCPISLTPNVGTGTCTASVATANPVTADNCSVTNLTWALTGSTTANSAATGINNLGTQVFNLGTTTVTYTASDAAGNTANCSYTVFVTDNENPTITAPAAIITTTNTACTATGLALGTAATGDNCSVASVTNDAPATFPLGNTTVTWTVTDGSGNSATATQLITVNDNVLPTITAPAAIITTTNTACTATGLALGTPTTGDNCSVASVTNNAPATFPLGNTTVTWTVTDGTGNIATATQLITVNDNVVPTITAPTAIVTTTNTACTATGLTLGTPTTGDNCSVASVTNDAPATFPLGNTTVTWTVTDGTGNIATATQLITVNDNVLPTITAPAAIITTTNTACTATGLALGTPTTGDNCSVASVTNDAPATFPLGNTTVTWTVTDGSGNSATATQLITVNDNVLPTITAPAAIITTTNTACTATGLTLGTPTTGDNCSVASVTNDAPATFPLGNTTVTWTVTDGSGNSATATQLITVNDNVLPTITAPAAIVTTTNTACTATGLALGTPTTGDNCSVASVTNNAPATFPLGNTTVTWTVTDGTGNIATATQLITVNDNLVPTITAPTAIVTTTNTACTATGLALGTPTTGDNCSVASVTNNAPATFPLGNTTVTWTVTDGTGNIATATQLITVNDNVLPTITAPAAIITTTNTACTATGLALGTPTTGDNCSVASVTNDAPATFPLGNTTVTWTVTDGSGNSATATQLITVNDNVLPTITAPAAIVTTTNTACTATGLALGTPTTGDNCSVASVTNNAPATFPLGNTTVTWTVTDGSGNIATATQLITVNDNVVPTITAPAAIVTTTNTACTATGLALGTPTTGDNCSVASVTNNAPATFPLGNTTVTWTVTDGSGNSATATQLITVNDNVVPTITAPAAIVTTTNTACTATGLALGTPTTGDNCSVASVTNNAPATFPLGNTTVTWTVTDGTGNIATATQLITVNDNVLPTITAPAAIITTTNTACTATGLTLGTPTTGDNCSVASVTNDAPATFPLGNTTVTWTVTDGSGNSATATQLITVNDNVLPTITAPAAIITTTNTACTATGLTLGTPTTGDNCSVASVTNDAPATFPLGNTTVTWTVTDGSGNSATATQLITVNDNVLPTITAPAAIVTTTNTACTATGLALGTPTTGDNCSVASVTNNAPATFPLGNTTVTWTVTDGTGNIATATQLITVNDNVLPTITAPAAIITTTNTACTATGLTLGTPTTGDNCSVASVTNDAPATFPLGNTTVTWTVTDGSGNSATATQLITVNDNVLPTITAPAAIITTTNTACTATGLTLGTPTTGDNCSVASVTNDAPATFPLGNTTVTWTVTDGSGNSATATQLITVNDNVLPTITAPAAIVTTTNTACTATGLALGTPTTGDNCSVASVTNNAPATFPLGNTTVTWTVTDGTGNIATATQLITVNDNVVPTITAPTAIVTTTNTACTATGLALGTPTTGDNCSVASVTNNAPATFPLGNTTVTWTVTDGTGNIATATQLITVNDNVLPTITAPAAIITTTNTACTATGLALGTPTTGDNCSVASVTNDAPATFPLGNTTVTWTVTDGSGNSATATQLITVNDNVLPTITAPAAIVTTTNTACTATGLALGTPTTGDNCSVASVTNDAPATFPLGNTTVTWTVTDGSGNSATATQLITVNDNVLPTITAPAAIVTTTNTACTATGLALGTPTTGDNCSVASVTNNAPATFPLGNTTVTWTVTDGSGNSATATQLITVNDNVVPTISCSANLTPNVGVGSCTASVANANPTTADNCAVTKLTWALTGATTATSAATGINNLGTQVFNLGTTTVTYRVEDAAGNFATCSYTVTVTDNIAPTITCSANLTPNVGVGSCTASVATANPTTADNCAVTKLTWALTGATSATSAATGINNLGTQVFNLGTTTVTYRVEDAAGNFATCSYTVTVTDTIAPTITCSANLTPNVGVGSCTASVATANPTTADNCAVTKLTWALTGATTSTSAATGINNLGTQVFNLGTTTVTYRVEDAAGNFTTCSYTITVTDNIVPTITCPSNKTAFTNDDGTGNCTTTVSLGTPIATDNCTTTGNFTFIAKVGGIIINPTTYLFGIGSTTVVWTALDQSGNTSAPCNQIVTVTDNENPIITTCPGNKIANTNSDGTGNCTTTVSLGTPIATDNCTASASLIYIAKVGGTTINPATYLFGSGTTTVVWTAIDQVGNVSAPCNQTVTITDNENPIITLCPANKTANTNANGSGDCSTTVNLGSPTATDNCGIASITAKIGTTLINPATYLFSTGNTTVTWVVTDAAGLTATCNQIVTIIDNENPTISCPSDQNVVFNTNCGFILLDYSSMASTSDNCDSNPIITQSPPPGTIISVTTIVTLTARDYSNRTSSCTFKVIPTDDIKPVAVCKNYTAYLTANGTVTVAASNFNNGSSDNCGIVNMTVSPNSFNCADIGTKTVTFTVYDNGGNSASCLAQITIIDNIAPTIICKNYVVVVDAITRVATIKPSDVDNGTNDACGIAYMLVSPNEFPDSPTSYNTTTTLTAYDVYGNYSTCVATVTVEPPKNQFTYLTGQITNPVPDNQQPPSTLIEATACPGGVTVPKDVTFNLQKIGTYNLLASQVVSWEYSKNNGQTWITIPGTAGLLTYTVTGLLSDTFVRVRLRDPNDATLIKTSGEAYVRFLPPDEPPIIVSFTPLDICLGNTVTVVAESFFDQPEGQFGKGGKFNYAQPDGWRVDGIDGFFPASGNTGSQPTWKETNSNNNANTTFSGINYDTSDNTKFAIAHAAAANLTTTLETPVFSTIGMTSSQAILTYYSAYYFCNGGSGKIELSFDAGQTYTVTLNTVQNDVFTAGNTTGVKVYNGGNCTNKQFLKADPFRFTSLNLGPYAGLSGLRIRWTFKSGPSGGTCNAQTFPKHSSNTCSGNQTFNVGSAWTIDDVGFNFAAVNDELEWTDENGVVVAKGTTATVRPVTPGVRQYGVTTLVNGCRTNNNDGTNFININTSLAYAGEDYMPLASNCGENTLKLNAYDNTITSVANYSKGAWKTNLYVVPNISAGDTNYKGTGVTGAWTVISSSSTSCGSSATFSSTIDPNAIFTADPGTYTLRWTLINGCYDDVTVTIIDCKSVNFDGVNDYVTFKNNYNLNTDFSIEVWVKPNSVTNTSTVFSRKNAADNTKGYDLSIVNGQVKFNWYNGSGAGSVTSGAYLIDTSRWYHLAATFNGSVYKLYVDGLELGSVSGTAPIVTATTVEAILGAMHQTAPSPPTNYFNGWVDELKIWNKTLSVEQIRQMMNQEIVALGPDVGGVVIPTKIYGPDADLNKIEDNILVWNDLSGYYRMNVVCGDLAAYKGVSGRLRNITTSEEQTAPIPYTTRINNQTWDTDNTWTNFSVWDVPNSLGINNKPIDWNIVKTSHKVTSNTRDVTLLGLIVVSNELIITNSGVQDENNAGHLLWLTHYLKLDGKIDLIGESQLLEKRYGAYDTPGGNFITIQFNESILEENSTGYIERDQQGKQNSFNYNYWSSPVSKRGGVTNSNYTASDVLRDGKDTAIPKTINFGDGAFFADGSLTSPIKTSNRWIWSYNSLTPDSNSNWDNYYQWTYKGSTGLITVGEGFTMKGSGGSYPIDTLQNYVFSGKPNSGTIPLFLAIDQTYLVGNPYPSALDANEFIKDNIKDCTGCRGAQNTFGGALYFWDHFGLSNNHILAEYEGGYSTYTLIGGVRAIANDPLNVNNGAVGTRIPQRYIPVGQGFFIDGDLDLEAGVTGIPAVQGGSIVFKNSQRIFVRENGSPVNSIFMKKTNTKETVLEDQGLKIDERPKIRLGFDSAVGAHRQLLVGVDENTSNQFDLGYDAQMFDTNENDIYWELEDLQLVIQAIQNFNDDQIIPFGLAIANDGKSAIKIDALENIPNTLEIYIYDKETGIYHDIKNKDYSISLPIGTYNNRFSLQFVNKLFNIDDTILDEGILVNYTNQTELININNNFVDTLVNKVYLFNILGQQITNWEIEDRKQDAIHLPVKKVSRGVYIVKVQTTNGTFSKKIIIN